MPSHLPLIHLNNDHIKHLISLFNMFTKNVLVQTDGTDSSHFMIYFTLPFVRNKFGSLFLN